MRCTNCGLPLSPTNTKTACPRCHISLAAGPHQVAQMPFAPVPTPKSPYPPTVQMWEPASAPTPSLTPPATPTPVPGTYSTLLQGYSSPQQTTLGQQYLSQPVPMPSAPTKTSHSGLLGYVIAALCIVTGGLLLFFVYFMGLAAPTGGTLSINSASSIQTSAVHPSPTAARPSPTTDASATANTNRAFPGQKYIANPQMASAVNTATAQPTQLTTMFSVNQKIYVTFTIFPHGNTGTVCLAWFLNNHPVTHYSFAAGGGGTAGYSYAIYGGTGTAYVQIAWANSNACTNALLAQQVTFSVIN